MGRSKMAQNKRLEMMENTFGRQLAADLAMTDFFEAVFNRKSEKVLDRLAKIACSYLAAHLTCGRINFQRLRRSDNLVCQFRPRRLLLIRASSRFAASRKLVLFGRVSIHLLTYSIARRMSPAVQGTIRGQLFGPVKVGLDNLKNFLAISPHFSPS